MFSKEVSSCPNVPPGLTRNEMSRFEKQRFSSKKLSVEPRRVSWNGKAMVSMVIQGESAGLGPGLG